MNYREMNYKQIRAAKRVIRLEREAQREAQRVKCPHTTTRWIKTRDNREADRYIGGINETEICAACGMTMGTAREFLQGIE